MIKQLAHLAFSVSDINKSLDFYINKLGFRIKFTLDDEDGNPWIVYLQINEGQFIELFPEYEINEKHHKHSSYQHFCLEVENIHEVVKNLESQGVKIDEPISMGMDNNYQCWIQDPDGNPIELMEYGKEALQLRKHK